MARFKFIISQIKWIFNIKNIGWTFNITQVNDWRFKITLPSQGFWILRDGYWDDNGIWIDSAVWID